MDRKLLFCAQDYFLARSSFLVSLCFKEFVSGCDKEIVPHKIKISLLVHFDFCTDLTNKSASSLNASPS